MAESRVIRKYMRGMCHVHAIASVRLHGGGYAIARDEHHGSVIHVWSVHDTPQGSIVRDVLGDKPATDAEMLSSLCEFFPELRAHADSGDVSLIYPVSEKALGWEDLRDYSEEDVAEATNLESVTRAPSSPDIQLLGM